MKIYYSNVASIKLPPDFPKIGILVSYFGIKSIFCEPWCDSLFLDSGAFSAFNQNVDIDLKKFIEFVQANKVKFEVIASLDDITSYKKSIENFRIMKAEGLNPIPCFHIGEPDWVLEEYIESSSYIALGGIAKQNKITRKIWLDRIFTKYPDQTKVGFHGFGIQARDIIQLYPWKSVDASSCHVMARFGGICSPWGDLKINKGVNAKDLQWVSETDESVIRKWSQSLDYPINYELACQPTSEGIIERCKINILYYERLAKETKSFSYIPKKKARFGMI